MKRKLATRAVSLFLSALMLFSIVVPVFAIEPPEDVPIIIGSDSSQTEKEYNLEGNGLNPAVDSSMDLEGKEFNVIPFPWKNIMEDKDGNIIPSARATQSIIECNWMKYINPKLSSQGEIPWLLVTIGGDVAYCVDTLNHSSSGGTTFVEKTDYTKLSAGQKDTIAYIMRYGAKTTAQDTNNVLLHMATQTLIWEVIDGERATYTLSGNSGGVYKDLVKRYPAIANKYNSKCKIMERNTQFFFKRTANSSNTQT